MAIAAVLAMKRGWRERKRRPTGNWITLEIRDGFWTVVSITNYEPSITANQKIAKEYA